MTKTIEPAGLPPLPEVDDATRREFLIGADGFLLLPSGTPGGEQQGEGGGPGATRTVRDHWYGTGPIAAGLVLDDIEAALGRVGRDA